MLVLAKARFQTSEVAKMFSTFPDQRTGHLWWMLMKKDIWYFGISSTFGNKAIQPLWRCYNNHCMHRLFLTQKETQAIYHPVIRSMLSSPRDKASDNSHKIRLSETNSNLYFSSLYFGRLEIFFACVIVLIQETFCSEMKRKQPAVSSAPSKLRENRSHNAQWTTNSQVCNFVN